MTKYVLIAHNKEEKEYRVCRIKDEDCRLGTYNECFTTMQELQKYWPEVQYNIHPIKVSAGGLG